MARMLDSLFTVGKFDRLDLNVKGVLHIHECSAVLLIEVFKLNVQLYWSLLISNYFTTSFSPTSWREFFAKWLVLGHSPILHNTS